MQWEKLIYMQKSKLHNLLCFIMLNTGYQTYTKYTPTTMESREQKTGKWFCPYPPLRSDLEFVKRKFHLLRRMQLIAGGYYSNLTSKSKEAKQNSWSKHMSGKYLYTRINHHKTLIRITMSQSSAPLIRSFRSGSWLEQDDGLTSELKLVNFTLRYVAWKPLDGQI